MLMRKLTYASAVGRQSHGCFRFRYLVGETMSIGLGVLIFGGGENSRSPFCTNPD